jgi:uncharacterized protein (DUF58 family)
MRHFFLKDRFFISLGLIAVVLGLGYFNGIFFTAGKFLLAACFAFVILDFLILYESKVQFHLTRDMTKLLSLGDENPIKVLVKNLGPRPFEITFVDELPAQLRVRDFRVHRKIGSFSSERLDYTVKPVTRGLYHFGKSHIFLTSPIGLIERRISWDNSTEVPVYPSIIQMKNLELIALARTSHAEGVKKIRRIGHSYEFEQIKNYVQGDDIRSINWKATSRRHSLMVNQYEDERSQQVYCILDIGRSMRMPFEGMSLLDYAVNASLVMCNVSLQKHDKAGLISFDNSLQNAILAERKSSQLQKILEALYNESESDKEADFELLYRSLNKLVPARSLLILFTNFESVYALDRALPVLRQLAKRHVLLLIFFENSEVSDRSQQAGEDVEEIYDQAIAAEFIQEKKRMMSRAIQFGIQAILTKPEDLSINTLNKYLELKARGMI